MNCKVIAYVCRFFKKHMVKTIKLNAVKRTEEKPSEIREAGFVPAVLYGPGAENINLKVKKHDIESMFTHHSAGNLLDIAIEGGETVRAIIKDAQRDPIRNTLIHLDFYKVDMSKKIEVEIPLHFANEAKAVKELGGVLIKNIEVLHAKCLPTELVDKLDVDLSMLKTMEDVIKISDLKLPASYELEKDPEEVIAHVIEPKVQVEEPVAQPVVEAEAAKTDKGEPAKEEAKKEVKK